METDLQFFCLDANVNTLECPPNQLQLLQDQASTRSLEQNVMNSIQDSKTELVPTQPHFNPSLPDLEGSTGNTDWVQV